MVSCSRLIPGPPCVKYILANESCERFSYYGLRAVLVLYMEYGLGLDGPLAIALFSYWTALAYIMPLVGGWFADTRLGKYNTILRFSLIYCLGSLVLSLSAIGSGTGAREIDDDNGTIIPVGGGEADPSRRQLLRLLSSSSSSLAAATTMGPNATVSGDGALPNDVGGGSLPVAVVGLVLIAIGTGGIKPCVSSFGADQFAPEDRGDVASYFLVFYFCINLGSVGSIILTPILRHHVGFIAAFAVPCALLLLATLIFVLARKQYTMKAPSGSVIARLFRVVVAAVRSQCCGAAARHGAVVSADSSVDDVAPRFEPSASPAPRCWYCCCRLRHGQEFLDGAALDGRFSTEDIDNTKAVWRLVPVFLCLPMFWSLFDQQGSSWVEQAKDMDLMGAEPEQMNVLNPILIMMLIPFMDKCVYPAVRNRLGIQTTPLRRMGTGMVLGAVSFMISAAVQSSMDGAPPRSVNVLAQVPQLVVMSVAEILVSVTGLEFFYAEAPETLKSTMTSMFLLTTAIGNIFTGVIYTSLAETMAQSVLYMAFAALMVRPNERGGGGADTCLRLPRARKARLVRSSQILPRQSSANSCAFLLGRLLAFVLGGSFGFAPPAAPAAAVIQPAACQLCGVPGRRLLLPVPPRRAGGPPASHVGRGQ